MLLGFYSNFVNYLLRENSIAGTERNHYVKFPMLTFSIKVEPGTNELGGI